MKAGSLDRQNYIDWLRAGAMFLLLFYHTGRIFDLPTWHVKNAVLSGAINDFNRFLDIWHMPLFFFLAGASVWYALGSRTPRGFTWERVLRLFVPLIFGMLIIVPPQVFVERIFDGDFSGSFLAWYPHTFSGVYSMDNAASGNLSWHHLWFLAYLFVFSLLLIPAFRYFRSEKRKVLVERIASFLGKPGAIFLPVIPLLVFNLSLRPIFGSGTQNLISDWANFTYYITIFFYGFMLVSNPGILASIKKQKFAALAVALIATLSLVVVDNDLFGQIPGKEPILLAIEPLSCWSWILGIIALGSIFLNFSNRLLKYASQAVLPVYILHQTLIVILGYFVVQIDAPVAPKYFLVIAVTLTGSLGIYELVRRLALTRFLFGMKGERAKPQAPRRAALPDGPIQGAEGLNYAVVIAQSGSGLRRRSVNPDPPEEAFPGEHQPADDGR
jgi:glucan biosynthesis protein C